LENLLNILALNTAHDNCVLKNIRSVRLFDLVFGPDSI
jgi:hypothetical protein